MADMEKTRITADEFLNQAQSTTITELINGEVHVSAGATGTHQDAVLSIAMYFKLHAKNGKTQVAPMDVYLDDSNVVQPDILWVAEDSEMCVLVDNKYWKGAPNLIVEVLSFSTANRDYRIKYDLYEKHGVQEYWLVDSVTKQVKVFLLSAQKQFTFVDDYTLGDTFTSQTLNVQVTMQKLLDY